METMLSPVVLGRQLGIPVASIYAWRSRGEGPRGFRVGKHVRYRQSDVDAWLERRADPAPAA